MAKLTNERKSQLRKTIAELEGLSVEDKSALIELLNTHKKYGLVWEDKPEDVEEAMRDHLPLLTEVKERAILSDSPEAPNHILIEGDNLEALTALSYTHEGKIDVIYIDPPYNTGNKDFIYNDSFVDSEDAYRHSKWLSFMSRRLKLAKRLLSDKGVIFISIGDDEIFNLPLLCAQVFGEKNYVETYIWTSTLRPYNSSPILRRNAEFIVCCCKNLDKLKSFNGIISDTSGMPSLTKAKEKIKTIKFPANIVKTNLADGIYMAGVKENGRNPKWELMKDVVVKDGVILSELLLRGHSYWATEKKVLEELKNGTEIWIKSETFVPYYKKMKESINRPTKILPVDYVRDGLFANSELNDGIFSSRVFNNPKPSTLISFLINFIDNKNSTILDFFAGSGTTLHATMQLNAEDGGRRKSILVTNNENNICEEVTYERNKRVINGYTTPKGEKVEGLKNNSLRYYKTKLMSRERTQRNMRELVAAATELLCVKEDLYEEKMVFGQYKVNPRLIRYFDDGVRRMLVIYREELIDEVVAEIEKMEYEGKMKIYLFAPGRYAFDDNFYPVHEKVTLCALPAAIYDAYEKVLPKHRIADDQSKDTECCALDEQNELGQQNYVEQMLFSNEGGEQ